MADVMLHRSDSNVVHNSLGKSSVTGKVLLIIFLLSIFLEVGAAKDCDFVKCIKAVSSYIYNVGDVKKPPFVCKKLSDIPWCSELCMRNYFPHAFLHGKYQNSFTKYCEENISNRFNANWSCIANHSYRVLSCLTNVNSLTTNNVREDMMLTESCRKYLEFQNCPEQVLLTDCGKESADVVKDLIIFILDNFQTFSCKGTNTKEVLSMPVYYHFGSDFVEAAKFLDAHQLMAHKCSDQSLQDEIDLDGYICGEYNPSINECIHSLLKNKNAKPDVTKLLLRIVSLSGFKCKQSSLEAKPMSTSLSDESKGISFKPKIVSTSISDESKEIKQNDYNPLKNHTITDLLEISTLKNIENSDVLHEKTEVPLKDSTDEKYVDINLKIINVSDSANKRSRKDMKQNVNSSNVCSRLDFSVHTLIFYFVFLLFIIR